MELETIIHVLNDFLKKLTAAIYNERKQKKTILYHAKH
jgi:hypothetical protein